MTATRASLRTPIVIILAGCAIATLGFGPRTSMGFFLTPVTTEFGWGREVFALALAIQNLCWGLGGPIAGMLADKFGTARVLSVGAVIYAVGLVLMSQTTDPLAMQLTAGLLVGAGVAGTSFALVLAAFARLLPDSYRMMAYGFGTAAGSFGQFLFAPLGQGFISAYGWQTALVIMASMMLAIPFLSTVVKGRPEAADPLGRDQTLRQAIAEAFRHRSYVLLVSGFFVCGFQVAAIGAHLPSYIADIGVPAQYGAYAIALIGLFNVFGSIGSGFIAGRLPKRWVLCFIYLARSLVLIIFVLTPPSAVATLIFAATMGILWLSTVPPTQGLVGVMFGSRYIATLYGFAMLSHQLGSFSGIWLGGRLFDATGSYNGFWWMAAAMGVVAALLHAPIVERPVPRPALSAA